MVDHVDTPEGVYLDRNLNIEQNCDDEDKVDDGE
jgi:hypothetical protein